MSPKVCTCTVHVLHVLDNGDSYKKYYNPSPPNVNFRHNRYSNLYAWMHGVIQLDRNYNHDIQGV